MMVSWLATTYNRLLSGPFEWVCFSLRFSLVMLMATLFSVEVGARLENLEAMEGSFWETNLPKVALLKLRAVLS